MFSRFCRLSAKYFSPFKGNGLILDRPVVEASRLFNRFTTYNPPPPLLNKVSINKPQMLPLQELTKRNATYQMGFATKPGLAIPYFPISHSAVCFFDNDSQKYIVLGRQSPFAFRLGQWNLSTRIDDEKPYLADNYQFDAIMTNAKMSEQEIQQMIVNANQHINEAQLCDMGRSNCYSNSTYMMADALSMMANRQIPPQQNEVESVVNAITTAAQHHFSIGVLNNAVVTDKIVDAFLSVREFCGADTQRSIDDFISTVGTNSVTKQIT